MGCLPWQLLYQMWFPCLNKFTPPSSMWYVATDLAGAFSGTPVHRAHQGSLLSAEGQQRTCSAVSRGIGSAASRPTQVARILTTFPFCRTSHWPSTLTTFCRLDPAAEKERPLWPPG